MEALAAGVPVSTRDLPVLREAFGDTVLYGTDPPTLADALLAAVEKPGPAQAERGRTLALARTWPEEARRHLDFYVSL